LEACKGVMELSFENGIASQPWITKNHECGCGLVPQMSVGQPDDRPNFELVNPPTMVLLMSQTERTRVIEILKYANVWRKLSSGGGKRHYARVSTATKTRIFW
jgi:hypothetical protein